jgi:hypothetical protein
LSKTKSIGICKNEDLHVQRETEREGGKERRREEGERKNMRERK